MRKHWKSLLVVLAAVGLLLTACGPQTAELEVTLSDFAFEPAQVSVPAGSEVTLTLTNEGSVEHEWVLVEQGYTIEPPVNDEDEDHIYWEAEVPAGETETFTFTAPDTAGEYQIVCVIAGHLESGMEGSLTVQ